MIIHDGRLLAWIARGGHGIATFLPHDEPEASHAADALARALIGIARRTARAVLITTIDGAPALEVPLAKLLRARGFGTRGDALVCVAPPTGRAVEGRRVDPARRFAERSGSVAPSAASAGGPDADELAADLEEIGADDDVDLTLPPDDLPPDDLPPDDLPPDDLPPDDLPPDDLPLEDPADSHAGG